MYVCMSLSAYAFTYVHIYVDICRCIYACMHVTLDISMHICIYAYMYVCIDAYMCICMQSYGCIYVYVHRCIHLSLHGCICTYIYICIHICVCRYVFSRKEFTVTRQRLSWFPKRTLADKLLQAINSFFHQFSFILTSISILGFTVLSLRYSSETSSLDKQLSFVQCTM